MTAFLRRRISAIRLYAISLMFMFILGMGIQVEGAEPLSTVFLNLEDASLDTVRAIARDQALNGTPRYSSTTPNETRSFVGYFAPAGPGSRLAIFSDDGCDVFVNGVLVHNRFQQGQHLPDLTQSLHEIGFSLGWQSGRIYHIRVVYSNTIFNGTWDVDGATLFAFGEESPGLGGGLVDDDGLTLGQNPPFTAIEALD